MKKVLVLRALESKADRNRIQSIIDSHSGTTSITLKLLADVNIDIGDDYKTIRIFVDDKPIDSFDVVYFRTWHANKPVATSLALYLKAKKIPFVDSQLVTTPSFGNKLVQGMMFRHNNIPTPRFLYIDRSNISNNLDAIEKKIGFPCIMKSTDGSHGDNNYLLSSRNEIEKKLSISSNETQFVFQKYIKNQFDYRFLVLGNQTKVVYKRLGSQDSHLNNISQGSSHDMVDLQLVPNLIPLANKASTLFNREICGVDIVIDENTNKEYVFEVNPAPGLALKESRDALAEYLLNL